MNMLDNFNDEPIQFMKEEKIKLTETIEMIMPNGFKRWVKIRVSGKGFTIEEAATDAKTKFEKALNVVLSNPSPTPSITDYESFAPEKIIQEQQVEKVEIGDLPAHIESCTDLKVLDTYKLLVKGKPDLEVIYLRKLNELS